MEVSVRQPVEFPLYLRVPFWARQPMVYLPDGEIMQVRAGETTCVRRKWRTGDVVRLELPAAPRLTRWYHQSGAVEIGPLLMAFHPEEHWTTLENGDRAIDTDTPWNWALLRDEPMKAVYGEERERAFGYGDPGVKVLVKAVRTEWDMEGGSAANVPMAPRPASEPEVIELVPFGDTCLRIGQFPVCVPTGGEGRA